jgi:hypothetical protein
MVLVKKNGNGDDTSEAGWLCGLDLCRRTEAAYEAGQVFEFTNHAKSLSIISRNLSK